MCVFAYVHAHRPEPSFLSAPLCLGIPFFHRLWGHPTAFSSLPHTHCPALLPGPAWVLSGRRPLLLPSLPAAVPTLSSEVPPGVSLLSDQHPAHVLSFLLLGAWTNVAPEPQPLLDWTLSTGPGTEPAWLNGVQASCLCRPTAIAPCPGGNRPKPGQQKAPLYSSYNKPPGASDGFAFSFCTSACGRGRELRATRRAGGLETSGEALRSCQELGRAG